MIRKSAMTTRPLKKKSLLLSIMLALFSSLALSISLDPLVDASQIEGSGSADRFLNSWERIIFSIEGFDLSHLLLFVFLAMVIYHYIHKIFLDKRTMLVTAIVSSLLTFFTITGIACISTYRYGVFFSGDLRVIKLVFLSFAYFLLFFFMVFMIYDKMLVWFSPERKPDKTRLQTGMALFNKHTFLLSLLIITLFWLPFIIGCFPAYILGDTQYQLMQVFNIGNYPYNDSNPIAHTLVLGWIFKLGDNVFGSQLIGLYIYVLLQVTMNLLALSLSLAVLSGKHPYRKLVLLLIYCLIPYYPEYATLSSKDGFFTPILLAWIVIGIKVYEKLTTSTSKKKNILYYCLLILLSTFLCFFRKNGIYTLVITGVVFLIRLLYLRMNRRIIILCLTWLVSSLMIFEGIHGVMIRAVHAEKGNTREVFSVPFQQTARYLKYHEDEVTKEEKEAISKILDYDLIKKNYNPVLADPVKITYKTSSTSEDLKNYFIVWFKMLLKHPEVYVASYLHNYWGYFYPSEPARIWYEKEYYENGKLLEVGPSDDPNHISLDRPRSKVLYFLRQSNRLYYRLLSRLPGFSLFTTSAFYNWILLLIIGYLFIIRRKRYIIYLVPLFSLLLVYLLGPCNGYFYFRYEYTVMYALFYLLIHIINRTQEPSGADA